MRYLSVCSGIEAATCAWHPLGWTPVGFSEIEPFPAAVLAHHYPDVPNLGDMTRFQEWPDDLAPDLIVGGTPCQSFSVAGLRKGLADPRGNLALVYLALADRYRPEWLVWENVPGVLSSNGGRDFGAFLGGLVQLGYGFAYRVLDAQYFGVAQRRRRVFVVANARDWRRAAAVLFDSHGLSGNPAPRRETGKGITGGTSRRPDSGHVVNSCKDHGADVGEVSPTLRSMGHDGSHANGGGQVAVAFAHQAGGTQTTLGYDPECGTAPTLAKCQTPAVAIGVDGYNGALTGDVAATMGTRGSSETASGPQVMQHMAVRRLMPVECERLQGFPDGYTDIGKPGGLHDLLHRKPTPDGPRYKALGNSMAVPVMAWIGRRIAQVAGQDQQEKAT